MDEMVRSQFSEAKVGAKAAFNFPYFGKGKPDIGG
jgi:hypothetical protein